MELDLNNALSSNGHARTNSTVKQQRAEMAGAVPIPEQGVGDTEELSNTECGYCVFKPRCLQYFTSIKWFLFFMSAFVLFQSLLVSGYTSSVITTIEQRYDLRSSESGLIVSSFDIGSLLVVVFISYFGGKGHRPKCIGIGAVTAALGAVLFASPQFISYPYKPSESSSESFQDYLCVTNETSSNSTLDQPCEAQAADWLYIFLFVLSNMIVGIGSTPIYTLGTTFIYDNSPREGASLYISIMYLMGAIGPALGYLTGGFLLKNYVDIGDSLPEDDPRFIGAWWSGYLLSAGLIAITSLPLLGFPKKLPKPPPSPDSSESLSSSLETPSTGTPVTTVTMSEEEPEPEPEKDPEDIMPMDASMSFGKNFKDLPRAFLSLITNPVFLCITVTATLEFSIVTAFLTFVPKYLQNQFDISPTDASMYTGIVLVPSAGGGIMLGGYIIKRMRLNLTGCAKVTLISNILSLLLFISVFLIACKNPEIIRDRNENCADCSCDVTGYEPICLQGSTYYNPCIAGCSGVKTDANGTHVSPTVFTNCSCIDTTAEASSGICERDCQNSFIPFMVCLFLVTFTTACTQTPALMVTLRCVKSDERPFAMGIQFVFFRALAYIPAPIYFGTAIDQACMIWRGSTSECDDGTGACLVYDTDMMRYIYFGLAFSLKFVSSVFVFFTWIICRKQYTTHNRTTRYRKQRQRKRKRLREQQNKVRSLQYGENPEGNLYGRNQVDNRTVSLPGYKMENSEERNHGGPHKNNNNLHTENNGHQNQIPKEISSLSADISNGHSKQLKSNFSNSQKVVIKGGGDSNSRQSSGFTEAAL